MLEDRVQFKNLLGFECFGQRFAIPDLLKTRMADDEAIPDFQCIIGNGISAFGMVDIKAIVAAMASCKEQGDEE